MHIKAFFNRASNPVILPRESKLENKRVKKHTLTNMKKWPENLFTNFKLYL